jgi:hypothetical protein
MSNIPRAHHYLPRFYLKNFALKKGKTFRVHVYDLDTKRQFVTAIENIAQETDFNGAFPGSNEPAEPVLAKLENYMSPAVGKLISTDSVDRLTAQDRKKVATFCATMATRTPATRNLMEEVAQSILSHLRADQAGLGEKLEQDLVAYTQPENLRNSATSLLFDSLATFSSIFSSMKWVLKTPPEGALFHTSDAPIVRFNPIKSEHYGTLGLLSKGIQVYMPLSSSLVLQMYHEKYYPGQPEIREYSQDNLLFLRGLLVSQATRFLISQDGQYDIRPGMRTGSPRVQIG